MAYEKTRSAQTAKTGAKDIDLRFYYADAAGGGDLRCAYSLYTNEGEEWHDMKVSNVLSAADKERLDALLLRMRTEALTKLGYTGS